MAKGFREASGARASLLVPDPIVRRIHVSAATSRGRVKPYVFQSRCAKGGEVITEHNAWEATTWEWNAERHVYDRKHVLLCEACGGRAKRYYDGLREKNA